MLRQLLFSIILSISLLICPTRLLGQWQADFSGYNIDTQQRGWHGDTHHFYIHAGYLSLNGLNNGGNSLLTQNIALTLPLRWTGRIRFDHGVSAHSKAYILLGKITNHANTSEYIALAVQGGLNGGVELISLKVDQSSSRRTLQEKSIHKTTLTAINTWRELSYDIHIDESYQFDIRLNDHGEHEVIRYHHIGQWGGLLSTQSEVGVLCIYDSESRQGIHFADFKIQGGATQVYPLQPPTDSNETLLPLLLSEIMTYPTEEGVQYIELYNPSETPIDFNGYSLGIGKDSAHLEYYYLDLLAEVPPLAYVVLSSDTEQLGRHHKHLPWGRERQAALPHMPVHSGTIRLYRDRQLVDSMSYSPQLHHPSLKRTKGVALERRNLQALAAQELQAYWTSASSRDGYSTPGYPAGTEPIDRINKSNGQLNHLDRIIALAEENSANNLRVNVYTMAGETLVHMRHMDALSFLKALRQNPRSTLGQIPSIHRGIGVLSVVLEGRVPKRYSLKFFLGYH